VVPALIAAAERGYHGAMRTVLVGERPPEVEDLLQRRRALGQDLFDEVWEGDYHMGPAPHGRHGLVDFELVGILRPYAMRAGLRGSGPCNIGKPDDYRVPDQTYFAGDAPPHTFHPTAEIVVEIVSPGDESRLKNDFYFRMGVAEVVIVDPEHRTVEWFVRDSSSFRPTEHSNLLDISATTLTELINWPQ
jgi:Uma2 family endonuclease